MNQLDWEVGREQPDKEQVELAKQKEYETDVHFLTAFSTPSGQKVIDWLVSHTLDTPTWWPAADYNKTVANGFFREGQNCLVRQIKAKIERARTYQDKK